ncbi:HAMP domain-containing protein [Stakelama sp. CBK3Z-3]|uniref:HAMP domain-containing protein n=1 Tax=Stakelama flava TaxID=2860338 RepID=A0ABS6XJR9_9SPHN|nr:methyl-accepting chemotaxis protein [Stakelama flava]MBW4330446.1 HAMP domain-containing protein [Stakelama flava]
MKRFNDLRIAAKIAILMIMLGGVTLFAVFNGVSKLRSVDAGYNRLVAVTLPDNTELARSRQVVTEMMYAGYQIVTHAGDDVAARNAAEREQRAYDEARRRLGDMKIAEPDAAAAIDPVLGKIETLHGLIRQSAEHAMRGDAAYARRELAKADASADEILGDLRVYTNQRVEAGETQSRGLSSAAASTVYSLLIVGILGTVVAVGAGVFVAARTITGPLKRLSTTMRELSGGNHDVTVGDTNRTDEVGAMAKAVLVFRDAAQEQARLQATKRAADEEQQAVIERVSEHLHILAGGDLSRPITQKFPENYAALKSNYNAALESLRTLIAEVLESARTIGTGSQEIQSASEDLARRTESNAASLEETTAAVAQITDRLQAGAKAGAGTVRRADQAIATVGSGRETAEEAVQSMSRVSESAKGIDSVIEGLDKIAFQTRVLAMNAAVEAGRAGEAGRGFAVVADLVGQLAMRSEEEAKRAREQLTTTQTDVEMAVTAVHKVDAALVAISDDVGSVHEALGAMADDNTAQASAIQQISAAIGSLDESTQQNAAMVEEASAAARNLNSEVRMMSGRAGAFTLGDTHGTPQRGHARSAAALPAGPAVNRPAAPAAKRDGAKPVNGKAVYQSPVKPLPAEAVKALVVRNNEDDWDEF